MQYYLFITTTSSVLIFLNIACLNVGHLDVFLWSVTLRRTTKQSDSNVCWCRSWWFYIKTRLSNSLLSKVSPQFMSFPYRDKSLSFTLHICMIICALPQHHAVIDTFDTGYYQLQTDTCTQTREGQNKNISALLNWEYTFVLNIKSPKEYWGLIYIYTTAWPLKINF